MEDNLKISQMPPVETATGEEMIPCVTGSPKQNKSVTVSKIRQGMVKDESYVHTDNNFTTQLKTKLDGIQEGAQKNTVIGVKGNAEQSYRTGNVNITKDNIGLSKVDNTSDAEKPVSTAQKAAIDKKVDKVDGKALSTNDLKIDKLVDEHIDILDFDVRPSTKKDNSTWVRMQILFKGEKCFVKGGYETLGAFLSQVDKSLLPLEDVVIKFNRGYYFDGTLDI